MPTMKQIIFASLLALALCCVATAQDSSSATVPSPSLTITAAASGDRVRITATSSVVQMHVEVYAGSGEKLFDQEIRGGNVFDWHLQDGQAQRLAPGSYVCVVTAKSISGKLTQKIGTVKVAENSASVQPPDSLSAPQAQTIGPVEENSSWTIPGTDAPQTPTMIAHDGTDGQMIRGRGALSFRIGNFFSGIDTEQMRLTEEGNLGIGTSAPQAKLDVAGTIRAERFLVAKPKTSGVNQTDSLAAGSGDSVQPLIAGSGTQNRMAKWTDLAGTTLGDSAVTETGGNVGIGTPSPTAPLTIQTPSNAVAMKIFGRTDHFGFMQFYKNDGATLEGSLFAEAGRIGLADSAGAQVLNVVSGNVGIGTPSPTAPLTVQTPINAIAMKILGRADHYGFMQFYKNDGATLEGSLFAEAGRIGLADSAGAQVLNVVSGNVGVGTSAPSFKLEVMDPVNKGLRVQTNAAGGTVASFGGFGDFQIDEPGVVGGRFAVKESGRVGIGTATPAAKLSVVAGATEILGTAQSSTFRTTAGSLGNNAGDELSLASIGFFAVNNSSLGIRGRRITSGTDWTTTAIGLGMDVDNTVRAGDATLWLHANGNVGIGQSNPTSKLTVQGTVQSNSGGFKFPDGTVQTTAANATFTKLRGPNLSPFLMLGGGGNAGESSAILLTVPTGTYVISATVEFRNNVNNFGQNNSRRITCELSGGEPYSFDIDGSTRRTVTFHSVLSVSQFGTDFNVGLFCFHNGNAQGDDVETATSRLTAMKIEGNLVVQTDN